MLWLLPTMQWYFVAALLTVLTSSQGILTTLSQINGGYKYDYSTVPLLAEVFKFATLTYVDTTHVHVPDNGDSGSSSERRSLSNIQWMAIILLAVGTTTSHRFGVIFNMGRLLVEFQRWFN